MNQTGVMSGAEYVLANVIAGRPGASALLLEDGSLARVLIEQGVKVNIAASGAQLGAIRRDKSFLSALPLTLRLHRLIISIIAAARDHDVVYANSQKAFLLCAIASVFFRLPLIWHLHDIIDERHFGSAQRRTQVLLANRRAKFVIVPSQAAADAFVKAGGRAELLRVVPNGINLTPAPRLDRAALGLPDGPLIGVFSRLAPWKGQHIVLEALEALPDLRCILVGSALFGEDDYRHRLETMVARDGLRDRAIFLGQRSDVLTLMQAVDAVIHPSIDPEPFGLTIVEAMLAGTPVIASDCGASAEILGSGNAGTLVPPGDAAALAEAVRSRFSNSTHFMELATVARNRVDKLYDVNTMRDEIYRIIADVAG